MSVLFGLVVLAATLVECWALVCVPSWVTAQQRSRLRGWRAHAAVIAVGVLGLSVVQSLAAATFGAPRELHQGQPAKVTGSAKAKR